MVGIANFTRTKRTDEKMLNLYYMGLKHYDKMFKAAGS